MLTVSLCNIPLISFVLLFLMTTLVITLMWGHYSDKSKLIIIIINLDLSNNKSKKTLINSITKQDISLKKVSERKT